MKKWGHISSEKVGSNIDLIRWGQISIGKRGVKCRLKKVGSNFVRGFLATLTLRLSLLRDLRLGTVWVSGLCPLFLYTLYTGEGLKGYGADSAWVRSTLSWFADRVVNRARCVANRAETHCVTGHVVESVHTICTHVSRSVHKLVKIVNRKNRTSNWSHFYPKS